MKCVSLIFISIITESINFICNYDVRGICVPRWSLIEDMLTNLLYLVLRVAVVECCMYVQRWTGNSAMLCKCYVIYVMYVIALTKSISHANIHIVCKFVGHLNLSVKYVDFWLFPRISLILCIFNVFCDFTWFHMNFDFLVSLLSFLHVCNDFLFFYATSWDVLENNAPR